MIAITGANGNLGRATINYLLQQSKPENIVAIVRNPQSVSDLRQRGVNVRQASYDDLNALENALIGIETLVQISTTSIGEKGIDEENNVVRAAVKAGVVHIVYTSSVKANENAYFIAAKQSVATEKAIRASEMNFTFFRNSLYMEALPKLLGHMLNEGQIFYSAGQGKTSFVSRVDIAEAIAKVCLTPANHQNVSYEITGNKAYTFYELADLIKVIKKDEAIFHDISIIDYKEELIKYQLPTAVVELLVSMAKGIRNDEFAFVDDKLREILGRDPISLSEYLLQTI